MNTCKRRKKIKNNELKAQVFESRSFVLRILTIMNSIAVFSGVYVCRIKKESFKHR